MGRAAKDAGDTEGRHKKWIVEAIKVGQQATARRMLSYLDNSEASKVSTQELKERVLSPK